MAVPNQANVDLPKPMVLVMGPPKPFQVHEKQFSEKFNFIKPWESPSIPLLQFLSTNAVSVQAMLTAGICRISAEIIGLLPELKLILTTSAGVDHIDFAECRRRGIRVGNTAHVFSENVADLAVGLLIDVMRRISAADRFVKTGGWLANRNYPLGSKLGGKRVGIVGLGSIGLEVAKRLQAFGCIISYNSRNQKPSICFPFYSDVLQLAADSDVLIICCALSDKTRHMINKDVFSALGKEGVVVNVARGAVVDEKELVRCLVGEEIAGAGLDVFENEPHVPKELFGLDNVVLSSHCAVFTHEAFEACYELMSGNLEAFFSNRPLRSLALDYE